MRKNELYADDNSLKFDNPLPFNRGSYSQASSFPNNSSSGR